MANPILSRTELLTSIKPMTAEGVVNKTALLLAASAASGLGLFFYGQAANLSGGILYALALVGVFGGMALGLLSAFKPHLAKTLALPYALTEGLLLGAVSLIAYQKYPSVPLSALSATFITAAVMLTLYRTGVIKVTEKFRTIVTSAVIAIGILYLVQLGFRLFGSSIPVLFDGGMVAIGFSVFVIIIASLTLVMDFDNVDRGVKFGIGQEYEWVFSIGILSTLVWMYVEFVRLLGYLQDE